MTSEPTLWESDPVPPPEDHSQPDRLHLMAERIRDASQRRYEREQARALGDAGMAQAADAADVAVWREAFTRTVERMAAGPSEFTSEDVLDEVGLPRGEIGQHRNNAVGALMNAAARRGVIRRVRYEPSRRPSSHGAVLTVWVGAAHG